MPVLKANTITNAKLGSTDIRAVYRGSTEVYRRPPPEPMSWLPINMELRTASDIWISPNQSEGDVCCWVVADSMRPYYMDDRVEMAYGGVPGIYPGGMPISEGPEMVVDGVAYKPITFHINVLTPEFKTGYGHNSTDWQFSQAETFTTIVHQSLGNSTNLLSYTLPGDVTLLPTTTYYVRARFNVDTV